MLEMLGITLELPSLFDHDYELVEDTLACVEHLDWFDSGFLYSCIQQLEEGETLTDNQRRGVQNIYMSFKK